MKISKLLLALFSMLLISYVSVDAQKVTGSGSVVTQKIEMRKISNIGLGISANVYLRQGSKQSIEIKGQQNIIDLINKEADGDSWDIKFPNNARVNTNKTLEIYITIEDLESLNIGGSGSIIAETAFKNLEDVKMNIGGSGSIKIEIEADDISCNLGGSGNIELAGSADEIYINIGGSGSVKAIDLETKIAKVNSAGSGSATLNTSESIDATIVGSGGVKYKGSPRITKTVMGSGRVKAY